jgi:guanylate kinase
MTAQINNQHMGSALIFSGPHGAGKDTLEGQFRQIQPATERIVRHITRSPAPGEVDGQDYHFVDNPQFVELAEQNAFIEHSTYPDCMAGTSRREITDKLGRADFASISANFEEGLMLHRALGVTGLSSVCFFISPVSREAMRDEPELYVAALQARMERRGRPADRIANKLAKALLYRELYFQNESRVVYVDNSDGNLRQAVHGIDETARAHRAANFS